MGDVGKKIVKLDVNELINLMNKALADEWLAYYQYWIGAKLVKGPRMESIIAELKEHAQDELRHAEMLTERILVLGGTPILNPNKWEEYCNCKYLEPTNPESKVILEQNIKGERCAIGVYKNLVEMTEGKDPISYKMLVEIMEDEVEHEEDLETLLDSLSIK